MIAFYYSGNSSNIWSWNIDNLYLSHPIESYRPPHYLEAVFDSSEQKVLLNWTEGYTPNIQDGYRLQRKRGLPSDSTSYSTIAVICGIDSLSYIDSEIQPNEIYTYRVCTIFPCPDYFSGSIFGNEATAYIGDIITSVKIKNELPTEFYLEQNYPNPFNPTTKIKFTVPTVERFAESLKNNNERIGNSLYKVQLKVYDVLGREIATLVNEEKPAGIYEVEFNASKLPSGIYFYQLRTDNFVDTMKMILLK